MRTGVLYRAASLDRIGDAGRLDLQRLGVRSVLDLRSASEVERSGRFEPGDTGIVFHHVVSPFGPPNIDPEAMQEVLADDDPMLRMYRRMVTEGLPMFRDGLRLVADGDDPAVVHCTSGKDRTGLFSLFVQLLCGVPLETALADYDASAAEMAAVHDDMQARFPEMSAVGIEKIKRMSGTDRSWVEAALDEIGGADALGDWLDASGVDRHAQQRIRARFLD